MSNPKETKDELEYLPIECPRCQAKGRLRIDRRDRSFTCKQCKRVFHVTAGGIMPGEKPPEPVETEVKGVVTAPPTKLEKLWSKLPKDGKTLIGGLIAIGFLVLCN